MHAGVVRRILDVIAPRTCAICGRRLAAEENVICSPCLIRLPMTDFLDNPYENEMAKVFWGRIRHFQKAFAFIYHLPHSGSANIIYQLKYFDKPETGIDMGEMMGMMMKERGFFSGIDCIVPVPLAKKRQKTRGYNQSEMIAQGLHDVSGVPVVRGAVRRKSFEGSQTEKSRTERFENVEHVFELVDGSSIKGRHVLIVDDVVTTGATVCALAGQLEKVEGVSISVASIGYAGEWRVKR